MTTSNETMQKSARLSGGVVAGAILILAGISVLAQQLFHFDFGFLTMLAVIFLAAGLIKKNTGLVVPGSILASVSLGVTLMAGRYPSGNDLSTVGIFFLALAGGFGLISLLSVYTSGIKNWANWALFPAAGLSLFGAALMSGEFGLKALEYLGQVWPVILIVIGGALILKKK